MGSDLPTPFPINFNKIISHVPIILSGQEYAICLHPFNYSFYVSNSQYVTIVSIFHI